MTPSEQNHSFREFMSTFYTGVIVVTCVDGEGVPHGLTCTSVTSVTLSPPTLVVCLNAASGTVKAIQGAGRSAVNLLQHDSRATAELFASSEADRFAKVGWRPSPVLAQPWLTDVSLAVAECRLAASTRIGTHVVVFGSVEQVDLRSALAPLLYGRRGYARVGSMRAAVGGDG